jgi:hypothetical protein
VPDALTLRFQEWNRYDPDVDAEVVMLQGITGKGTFTAQFVKRTSADLRQKRHDFREYVQDAMQNDVAPHEVSFEEPVIG